jgi:hypothetical protein
MGISGVPYNKIEIIDAIHSKRGVIKHAAEMLDCCPQTIYDWMDKDADVAQAVKKAREDSIKRRLDQEEDIKDEAYQSVLDLLKKRDSTTTIFTLKSKCGWTQGQSDTSYIIQPIDKPYRAKDHTNSPSV